MLKPWPTLFLLSTFTAAASAAPVPPAIPDEKVSDPAKFLPTRKYTSRPGTVVGVLIADAVPVMSRDGRSSQPDAIAFSRDGGSYNWLYVPVDENPQITNLKVRVGEKGDAGVVYPMLSMANPKTTKGWKVSEPFTLVEVTVNDGRGAPADEAFVASAVTVVEGSKRFPLKAAAVVRAATAEYAKYTAAIKKDLDAAMAKSLKAALKGEKPTGPEKTEQLVHVTWLPDDEQLAVTFLSKRTDGVWKKGPGGAELDRGLIDPPPLLVKPGGGAAPAVARRPPPPDFSEVTWGTGFGVEFGRTYVYNNRGQLVRTVTLTPKAFKTEIPPPPVVGRPGFDPPPPGGGPLPPKPPKK